MYTGIDFGAASIKSINGTLDGLFKTNPNDSSAECSHIRMVERPKFGSSRNGSDNSMHPFDGGMSLEKSMDAFIFM
jgi:hypothetical protein